MNWSGALIRLSWSFESFVFFLVSFGRCMDLLYYLPSICSLSQITFLQRFNKHCRCKFQAANYLNIKSLLDLTCQTVADMIKGKTPEEIRKTFNIKNDFTPEEEEEVRRENAWAFE